MDMVDILDLRTEFIYELAKVQAYILEHDVDENEINYIVSKFGKLLKVSRFYVYRHVGDIFSRVSSYQTNECKINNFLPVLNNHQNTIWNTSYQKGSIIHGLTTDFYDVDKNTLDSRNILSIAIIPLYEKDKKWGIMGFEDCKKSRIWSEFEIDVLTLLSKLIVLVYDKIKKNQKINKVADQMKCLLGKFKITEQKIKLRTESYYGI